MAYTPSSEWTTHISDPISDRGHDFLQVPTEEKFRPYLKQFPPNPKLLLLDEPLSALDLTMREKLQQDIKKFHKEFDMTTIMVSHDPSEIYKLSSRVNRKKSFLFILETI